MSEQERDPGQELRAFAAGLGPTEAERQQILQRLRAGASPAPARSWPVGLGLLVAAAAAAAISAGGWALVPEREGELGPVAVWQELSETVAVYSAGSGRWRERTVFWDEGELRLSVTPDDRGPLRILTPEAVIDVRGAVFRVSRDAYGTSVETEDGQVRVTCVGEAALELQPGAQRLCLRGADAGLGHVMRLQAQGQPPDAWGPELERALAHPRGTEQARLELEGIRIEALLAAAAVDEAARHARALLPRPQVPHALLSSVAGALLERDGCEAAQPFLARLSQEGDGVASVWLADCTPDPVRRAEILSQGLQDARPEVRSAIEARFRDQTQGHPAQGSGRR